MTTDAAIELTIPRYPHADTPAFCHRCMRAADRTKWEPELVTTHLRGFIELVPTGQIFVEVQCHGEEWHAHLRGDGTWAIRAVA
jgi:hypothetical protein